MEIKQSVPIEITKEMREVGIEQEKREYRYKLQKRNKRIDRTNSNIKAAVIRGECQCRLCCDPHDVDFRFIKDLYERYGYTVDFCIENIAGYNFKKAIVKW